MTWLERADLPRRPPPELAALADRADAAAAGLRTAPVEPPASETPVDVVLRVELRLPGSLVDAVRLVARRLGVSW